MAFVDTPIVSVTAFYCLCVFSAVISPIPAMSGRRRRVCDCGQKFLCLDKHLLCPTCRSCSRAQPCDICSKWTQKEWNNFAPSLDDVTSDILEVGPSTSRGAGNDRATTAEHTSTEITSERDRQATVSSELLSDTQQQVSDARPSPEFSGELANQGEAIPVTSSVDISLDSVAVSGPASQGNVETTATQSAPVAAATSLVPVTQGTQGSASQQRAFPDMAHQSPSAYQGAMFPGNFNQGGAFSPYGGFPQAFQTGYPYQPTVWNYPNPFAFGHQQAYRLPTESNFTPVGLQQTSPVVMPGCPTDFPGYGGTEPPQSRNLSARRRAAPKQIRSAPSSKGHSSAKRACTPSASMGRPSAVYAQRLSTHGGNNNTAVRSDQATAGSQSAPSVARQPSSRVRDAAKRYVSASDSEGFDDSDVSMPSPSRSLQDPDAISIRAPSEDRELQDGGSDEDPSQSLSGRASLMRRDSDPFDTQSNVGETEDRRSDSFFSRCFANIYETFGEECPPPPPPSSAGISCFGVY